MANIFKPDEAWIARCAELSDQYGYTICGRRNRNLTPCINIAGKATSHLGEGACKYHGGRQQTPEDATATNNTWKHGKHAQLKTTHPQLQVKIDEISMDHDVFNLEGEILKLRAMAEILMEKQDIMASAKLHLDVSKVVERYHQILEGRKYVISIENVSNIIETVKLVIYKHVPDETTRHLIAQDLAKTRLNTSRPRPVGLIEGEVIDQE